MTDASPYMTITEAAKRLGVSRTLVYRALEEGELHREPTPMYKRGGPQRVLRADVEALYAKWHPSEQTS